MIFKFLSMQYRAEGGDAEASAASAGGATTQTNADSTVEKEGSFLNKEAQGTQTQADDIYIPEKFRVFKEDSTLDIDASSRKLAQSYSALEKHKGYSDVPPDSVDGYVFTPPEAFKDVFDAEDPIFKSFLQDAHAAGMTQKQVDAALNKYFEILPTLAEGAQVNNYETVKAEVEKMWPDEKVRKQNMQEALNASNVIAAKAGLTQEDIDASGLGDNPTFIKLMAAINSEFKEDKSAQPNGIMNAGGVGNDAEYQALIKSEAYMSAKHPEHAIAVQKAMAYRQKTHPEQENV